jgi:HD superfamily phosphohydrolase
VETIAWIVTRYREFERLYLQGTKSELELMLEEALTRLYAEILTHLARAVRFFGEKSMGEFPTLDSSKFSSLPERL